MKDQFNDLLSARLESLPEEKYVHHIAQLLPLIEKEQAKAHPFWFAKHLALHWWRMTHG
jgi:hypothetical protein